MARRRSRGARARITPPWAVRWAHAPPPRHESSPLALDGPYGGGKLARDDPIESRVGSRLALRPTIPARERFYADTRSARRGDAPSRQRDRLWGRSRIRAPVVVATTAMPDGRVVRRGRRPRRSRPRRGYSRTPGIGSWPVRGRARWGARGWSSCMARRSRGIAAFAREDDERGAADLTSSHHQTSPRAGRRSRRGGGLPERTVKQPGAPPTMEAVARPVTAANRRRQRPAPSLV
jgi:hypothetical protein